LRPEPRRKGFLVRSVVYVTNDAKGFSLLVRSVNGQLRACRAQTTAAACKAASCGQFDALFFDPVLRCANAKHLLTHLASIPNRPPIFIVSRECWLLFARFAVNLGIGGYYVLAGDINRLLADLDRYCARILPVTGSLSASVGEIPPLDGSAARFFLGTSPDAILLRRAVYRLRLSRDPVLVLGESGSGKELVSQMVHENSPVRDGPFIPVNASCLPEALAESQLFGTVRGAFTGAESHSGYFESADGGTLFLDEVAELTPSLQAKLLRVVEDGMITRVGSTGARRVSVRLICASNRDLGEMVGQGMFRADLYYRLDVLRLRIPPLRNRKEDIPLLAEFRLRERKKRLSLPALDRLRSYHWPGNVRQLFHCLDRAAGMTPSDIIYPEHLDF